MEGLDLEKLDCLRSLERLSSEFLVAGRDRMVLNASERARRGTELARLVEMGEPLGIAAQETFDTGRPVFRYKNQEVILANPLWNCAGKLEAVLAFKIQGREEDSAAAADSGGTVVNGAVVAESAAMKRLVSYALKIAGAESTVLLTGESGTGKEVLAALIHQNSGRADKPFLPINCGAIPAELMESEFFGYERGAFTGASREGKPGAFERADQGTLLLDEIGELPLHLQTKLLRVLETGAVTRLGGTSQRQLRVRIIAATNRNLAEMCLASKFRQDLFYRLNVISIPIPPLRERIEDIAPLAELFLAGLNRKYGADKRFAAQTLRQMEAYGWPGNVRELRNMVERLYVSAGAGYLELEPPPELYGEPAAVEGRSPALPGEHTLRELSTAYEQRVISETVLRCGGNVARAAELLGVDKSSLYRKLRYPGARGPHRHLSGVELGKP